ncbi:MAG: AMIN domain-containing protein, partial [Myxococcota bacterium]|nr:AMIN domain-containing protein [Myxococcota bacterium]
MLRRLVPALSLLVPALALAQGVGLNTISKVEVKGRSIEITGTKKPNFTTFTMTDPPRLVIDISEAVFAGVPDEMQVGNGTVTAIKTASYGSDASAIARVLIGFEKELETDIQSSGSKLVIKVSG